MAPPYIFYFLCKVICITVHICTFSIFIISFLNLVSVRLQIPLFAPSREFFCSFNGEWFLSFFILSVFFLFCELRENKYYGLGVLFICKNIPGYFGGLTVCGWGGPALGLDACCLFSQCVQTVILMLVYGLQLLSGRWKQWA